MPAASVDLEAAREVDRAGEHRRAHGARREPAALLVGPGHQVDRVLGGDPGGIERLQRLQAGEHAEDAVEPAAGRLAVHVRARHDRRCRRIAARAAHEQVRDRIDRRLPAARAGPFQQQGARPDVVGRERLAVDAVAARWRRSRPSPCAAATAAPDRPRRPPIWPPARLPRRFPFLPLSRRGWSRSARRATLPRPHAAAKGIVRDAPCLRAASPLPAGRRPRAGPVAPGGGQHHDPRAGRSRRRGDQDREALGRRPAQLDHRGRAGLVAGLRAQQEEPLPRSSRRGGPRCAAAAGRGREGAGREFSAGHARAHGPGAGRAARAQSAAGGRAHLGLGPERLLAAQAGLWHAGRGVQRLCRDERLPRPAAGGAAVRHGGRVRRAVRRARGADRAARGRDQAAARAR